MRRYTVAAALAEVLVVGVLLGAGASAEQKTPEPVSRPSPYSSYTSQDARHRASIQPYRDMVRMPVRQRHEKLHREYEDTQLRLQDADRRRREHPTPLPGLPSPGTSPTVPR